MSELGIGHVSGIRVGHYTDLRAATGCTVVLCESGAMGGVDVRGSAPGTRETDLLRPGSLVSEIHAVLLTGGSAFGLSAASGVVSYLEERGRGYQAGPATVPIVSAAVLFDLGVGDASVRPGPEEGYRACEAAVSGDVPQGSVGAGTGATVAKALGVGRGVKGGVGTAGIDMGRGVLVGAIVAVNAVGGIHDPDTGELVAGARTDDDGGMVDVLDAMVSSTGEPPALKFATNTTIGVVATNARLDREQACKLATVAHDGLALAVRPAHTTHDGDTMFALATGTSDRGVDVDRLCAAAVVCVARAIVNGVRKAAGLAGVPTASELKCATDSSRGESTSG